MLLVGIVLGAIVGLYLPVSIPPAAAPFLAVAVVASLDAIVGAAKARQEGNFLGIDFVEEWVTSLVVALTLTFLGERLNVRLYYAVAAALSMRVFHNFSRLRRARLTKNSREDG